MGEFYDIVALKADNSITEQGVRDGFSIVDDINDVKPSVTRNHRSAFDNGQTVEWQIKDELNNGNYVLCDKPPAIMSALGAVPKPQGDLEGQLRTTVKRLKAKLGQTAQNKRKVNS